MNKEKFDIFEEHVKKAFSEVAQELMFYDFFPVEEFDIKGEEVSVIIGITGANKGRILLRVAPETNKNITEAMNEGPLDEENEYYLFLAEFCNMFSGRAITYINNQYRGGKIRLTPPAVFSGEHLEIITPKIQSKKLFFKSELGKVIIDIGFEGV